MVKEFLRGPLIVSIISTFGATRSPSLYAYLSPLVLTRFTIGKDS